MASFQTPVFGWQGQAQPPPLQPPPLYPSFAALPPFAPHTSAHQAPDAAYFQANRSLNMGMIHRIAVLETELRIEKENKATVEQVNQYLLQQLSQKTPSSMSTSEHGTSERLNRAAHKIYLMKEKIRKQRRFLSHKQDLAEDKDQHGSRKPDTLSSHSQQPDPTKPPLFAVTKTSSVETSSSGDPTLCWDFVSDSDDSSRAGLDPTIATAMLEQKKIHALGLGIAPPPWKGRVADTTVHPEVPSPLAGQHEGQSDSHFMKKNSPDLINVSEMKVSKTSFPAFLRRAPDVAAQVAKVEPSETTAVKKSNGLLQSKWAPTQAQSPRYTPRPRGPARGLITTPGSPADMIRTQAMLMFQPSLGFVNAYRTIIVTNIPLDASLSDVLAPVFGGMVMAARYMNTMSICGSNSAFVTFRFESSARRFADYARQFSVKTRTLTEDNRPYDSAIGNITYSLLDSPTFPMTKGDQYLIGEENTTRLIAIYGLDPSVTPSDLQKTLLASEPYEDDHSIIRVMRDHDDVVYLECSSVYASSRVAYRIRNNYSLRSRYTKARFEPDPCDRPLPPIATKVLEPVEVANLDSADFLSVPRSAEAEVGMSTAITDEDSLESNIDIGHRNSPVQVDRVGGHQIVSQDLGSPGGQLASCNETETATVGSVEHSQDDVTKVIGGATEEALMFFEPDEAQSVPIPVPAVPTWKENDSPSDKNSPTPCLLD